MNLNLRRSAASLASVVVVTAGLATVGTVVGAAPASAGPPCSKANAGKTREVYGRGQHTFKLTESYRVEVARGSSYSREVMWSKTNKKTNTVKLSVEVSTKFSAGIFAEAEAKVGGEYGHVNETTELRQDKETFNVNDPGNYYVARGYETFKIPVSLQRCRRPNVGAPKDTYEWFAYNSGTVQGWNAASGIARCGDRYSAGTLRRYVVDHRC